MRKQKTIRVTRGNLTGTGATKTLAKADLDSQIDWTLRQSGPTIESRFGLMIVVAPSLNGWLIRVFDPAACVHGEVVHCSTFEGPSEYADVMDRARAHAAQIAWHPAVNDAEHAQASGCSPARQNDTMRWAQFQRDYTRLKAEGKTDGQAHAIACGYAA